MDAQPIHQPVLVAEVLEAFDSIRSGVLIDMTVGAGGHARALLSRTETRCHLIGIDRDAKILEYARSTLADFEGRFDLVQVPFDQAREPVENKKLGPVQGILFDLGVSSLQLDDPKRGFSFSGDGPLDMRMDQGQAQTAESMVREWSADQLEKIFREYGEEPKARRLAKAIVETRERIPLRTTGALSSLVCRTLQRRAGAGKHPATRVFQALRIAVNGELERVQDGLEMALDVLSPGGRLAVISFHSLEDRIVKNFFRDADKRGELQVLTRKPRTAGSDELSQNRRARSAKLRVAEKTR